MGISFRYISYKILMDNKIDTWKAVLVDFTDLPIDRIARIGGVLWCF